MISRAQQVLVKRAQREAALDDCDYREALDLVCHCRSTTDPRMTDRHVDLVLAYFEAIFWRKVDSGELQPDFKPNAIFRQRRYWAEKNPRQETSRDRYASTGIEREIAEVEHSLARLGFDQHYCASIRERVTRGRSDTYALHQYKAALQRTVNAKRRKISAEKESATTSKI